MIYRNSGEVSGQPPLNFKNYSGSIQDYLIEGNTSQNGTPTPSDPVEVMGCGEKTGNLFDESKVTINAYISSSDGNIGSSAVSNLTDYIDVNSTPFVISGVRTTDILSSNSRGICFYDSNKNFLGGASYFPDVMSNPAIFSSISIGVRYVRFSFDKAFENGIILNLGSTAIPYEPFGYKLPITCGSETNNIYLGEVETTRKIKKLVLTGEEKWYTAASSTGLFGIQRFDQMQAHPFIAGYSAISNFYVYNPVQSGIDVATVSGEFALQAFRGVDLQYNFFIKDGRYDSVNSFKAYLAAQYAAGTPVTIWYVLVTPETAIVNEPLHKIGSYADSISKTQSNLPIPTISGQNTLTIPTTISPSDVSLTLDQKEIEKIYEGGKREVELSGVPPISFNAIGSQLEDYLIEGNTSQNGTPTPDAPVEVEGCGERTGNLFDKSTVKNGYYISDATGNMVSTSITILNASDYIYIGGMSNVYIGNQLTNQWGAFYDSAKVFVSGFNSYGNIAIPPDAVYVRITVLSANLDSMMLNLGSTPLTYEPYGYKLPITVNGTEYLIYLGQVETTRLIKKLVLTGNEIVYLYSFQNTNGVYLINMLDTVYFRDNGFCSHYPVSTKGEKNSLWIGANNQNLYFVGILDALGISTSADFKSYLAQQYANGTPVTIWYVLATPQTSIVNEPLHKIGDYADTISKTQSNLPIPITTGSSTLSIETTIQPSNITIDYNKQTEIAEVYGGIGENYPIYYMNRTIEGISPIMFKGLGKDLKDYLICGNTSQNGTPAPEAPVDVIGCGVRTGNLLSEKYENRSINGVGAFTIDSNYDLWIGEVVAGQTYAISNMNYVYGFFTEKPLPNTGTTYDGSRGYEISGMAVVTVPSSCTWIAVRVLHGADNAMLNTGSAVLPYEPYGYKVPITVNGTEHPIYLGQVETTRRIKKLVLTAEEQWMLYNGNYYSSVTDRYSLQNMPCRCTHTAGGILIDNGSVRLKVFASRFTTVASNLEEWKSYLAAQYDAGTPVTVWYVLAEPETGIVNEPIHKIGNYADTINFAQAGVTIPTASGTNVLDTTSTVKPSEVSITGNIKPIT